MFPLILDVSRLNCAVVGNDAAAARRLLLLQEAGDDQCMLYGDSPEPQTVAAAGMRLVRRLPNEDEIAGLHLLFIAGVAEDAANRLAGWARRHRVLVNTEDVPSLCDAHVPAMVRRGDLLFTVSTGGRAPGLARRLRMELEAHFGREWEARLTELARARSDWKLHGTSAQEMARRTETMIAEREWL